MRISIRDTRTIQTLSSQNHIDMTTFLNRAPLFIQDPETCCDAVSSDVYTISSVRVGNTVTFTRNDGATYSFVLPSDVFVSSFLPTATGLQITLNDLSVFTVTWVSILARIGIATYTFNPANGVFTITDNQGNIFSATGNYKGVLAVSPALGVAGDYYFNTVGNEYVSYDPVRTKWLSMNDIQLDFGRFGSIVAGNPMLTFGAAVMTVSGPLTSIAGMTLEANSTIVGIHVQRQNNNTGSTLVIYKNNDITIPLYTAGFVLATRFSDSALNVDVVATDVLGAYVATGTLVNAAGYLKIKRKY